MQHPEAEAHFLLRCYQHYRGSMPTRLKEDFAGTCALAAYWADLRDDMFAAAVESHGPTLRWAQRKWPATRGRLEFIEADAATLTRPRVDLIAALNFSTFIYHDLPTFRHYLQNARRALMPGGMLIMDAYGGPGAMRIGEQKRRIRPPSDSLLPAFTYHWQQRSCDSVTARTDCRIHFTLASRTRRNAFRYDWRLWTLPELIDLTLDAGFADVEVWCDDYDAQSGRSDGVYQPVTAIPAREDWVAYVVALK